MSVHFCLDHYIFKAWTKCICWRLVRKACRRAGWRYFHTRVFHMVISTFLHKSLPAHNWVFVIYLFLLWELHPTSFEKCLLLSASWYKHNNIALLIMRYVIQNIIIIYRILVGNFKFKNQSLLSSVYKTSATWSL